jgi:hypothetical protein
VATREEKIKLDVTGADQSVRDLDRVGGTAKRVGESVSAMGREADKASKKVDDLGDEAKQTGDQLSKLERDVAEAKVALKSLGDEYSRTTDPKIAAEFDKQAAALGKLESRARAVAKVSQDLSGGTAKRVDPVKDILAQAAAIDRVASVRKRIIADEKSAYEEKAKRDLADVILKRRQRTEGRGFFGNALGGIVNLGERAGSATAGAIGSGASAIQNFASDIPGSTLVKGGVGAVLAPAAAATAGGAVLAGGAAIGVGAGVAGAIASNPERFKREWTDAIGGIAARWKDVSGREFSQPLSESIAMIKSSLHDLDIESPLKAASKYLVPLTRGVVGFVGPLVKGIDSLVEKAGPVVGVLEKDLPALGMAFEKAFSDIGGGADGGARALDTLVGIVGTAVIAVGKFVQVSSEAYAWLDKNVPLFGSGDKVIQAYGRSLDGASHSTADFGRSAADAAADMKSLLDQWDKYSGLAVNTTEAAIALEDAQDKLVEGWKRGAGALDISNDRGRENVKLALAAVTAAQQVRDSAIAAGDGSVLAQGKANAAYETTLRSIEDMLVKLGLTRDEAHKFVEQYDGRTVTMSVKVNVDYQDHLPKGFSLGNLLHHADGRKDTAPAGWAMVGERGPELAYFNRGDRVWSHPDTKAMLSSGDQARVRATTAVPASSGGGGYSATLPPMSVIEQALAAVVMRLAQDGHLVIPSTAVN